MNISRSKTNWNSLQYSLPRGTFQPADATEEALFELTELQDKRHLLANLSFKFWIQKNKT